jgi:hypothetical protein
MLDGTATLVRRVPAALGAVQRAGGTADDLAVAVAASVHPKIAHAVA